MTTGSITTFRYFDKLNNRRLNDRPARRYITPESDGNPTKKYTINRTNIRRSLYSIRADSTDKLLISLLQMG
jgi:hypothetical protein